MHVNDGIILRRTSLFNPGAWDSLYIDVAKHITAESLSSLNSIELQLSLRGYGFVQFVKILQMSSVTVMRDKKVKKYNI